MRIPPRILIVDDNPTNLEVLRVRLGAQGYELVTAVDGEDALAKVREFEPDLVLLDVMMPIMDGWDTLKTIKGNEATLNIPVVMVTAKIGEEDRARGLREGATDYICKPFAPREVVQRVKSILR